MSLYQPFLDYAINLLQERLELKDYPIPEGFEQKKTITGKGKKEQEVVTTSYGFASPKLRQIRAAHVEGGNSLQVLNFVIFPELNYDLPFFGADLVTLPGGHLIALDMQPLFHDYDYEQKYTQPILPIFEQYQQDLEWGGDFPEEAKPFFSPCFLWTRPQKNEIVETIVFSAFKDYLHAYLDFVKQAEKITDDNRLTEILEAQKRYLNYRAQKDPARGMFTRLYGTQWTEEYIHGFLFDLERKLVK
ncbi:phycoerythrobilin:ferredoxin oxidoreductase [Geminocystis sp. GBBB08]|uniref:phycoerythrobilin:ferredoxin oxidoreductase n=1 Tax=Geminocystis sp. GBBB08 TaxID=2604140 RepID=UPI0027E36674|nr:phycoerythrobilin:ferredoxin oxidoreductase [Geminocystis sp. GBBB08]MBL1208888.1 phycoerythrobilin:ferredoxin oxidoreductase [Geminocystis sp. GBBB08]